MRDLLARLFERLRATDRQQRLYILLGVVVAVVVLRYGVTWLGTYRTDIKAEIQLSARRLANGRQVLDQAEVTSKRLDALRERYQQVVSELVPGATPTLAAAALQERVSSVARDNNVRVQSTQVLREEALGPFTEISLRITAQADIGNLATLLATLEYGPPRVEIEFLELSRRRSSARRRRTSKDKTKKQEERAVSATLQVSAISQGSATQQGVVVEATPPDPVAPAFAPEERPAIPENVLGTEPEGAR